MSHLGTFDTNEVARLREEYLRSLAHLGSFHAKIKMHENIQLSGIYKGCNPDGNIMIPPSEILAMFNVSKCLILFFWVLSSQNKMILDQVLYKMLAINCDFLFVSDLLISDFLQNLNINTVKKHIERKKHELALFS